MHQSQLRATVLAVTIVTTVIFGFLGFGYAFGASLTCTNHFNCTMESCPSVCDRAMVGFGINSVGQLGVFAWLVVATSGRRFQPPAWTVVAAADLSVVVLAVSSLVTASAAKW